MNSSAVLHRGVATALCADRVADRLLVTGLDHDFATARAVAMLRHHGLDVDVHVDTDRRSLPALARGVAARGADHVIVRATPGLPAGLLRIWLITLRRECPGALLVCLHDGPPPAAAMLADLALTAGDDRALLDALGAAAAAPVVSHSPYLSRLVPAGAAARVGIEVASGRELRPAALVADEVRLLDRRVSGEQRVVVRGLACRTRDPEGAELLRVLAGTPRRRVRLLAEATPAALDETVVSALVEARVGLRLVVTARDGDDAAERMRALLEPVIAAGLDADVHLVADPADDAQPVAEAARTLAPGFTYELAPGSAAPEVASAAPDPDALLDAVRELGPGSATQARMAALEGDAGGRLQRLLCGGREGPSPAVEAPALLWLDPTPVHEHRAWIAAVTSLDAGIWSVGGGDGEPLPGSGLWPCEGDPSAAAAVCGFGHERELEVIPYADGRNAIPYGPFVLGLTGAEDVDALLRDADAARAAGTFPAAMAHPFTALADGVAFAGPGAGATARRLIVQNGDVRTGLGALPIGRVGDTRETLGARARAAQEAREARRGCAECPIADACSRDGSLERLLDDDAYCGMRRARPWLGVYVSLPALLRQVLRADPDLVQRADRLELRVGGFGGPLYYPPERVATAGGALAVIETAGRHFLADAASGRCARLTPDLATIVDGLLASGSVADTAAWLVRERDLGAEQARATVAQALTLLDGAGIGAGVRALVSTGETAVAA